MHKIIIIAAVAKNSVIGNNNQMTWNIPEDMEHFKKLTSGHPVIMGRKTWESLPSRFRPLPNRRNVVITRQKYYLAIGAEVAMSLEDALNLLSHVEIVFIIGGEQIYNQALSIADYLEITEVNIEPDGDAWFPQISETDWEVINKNDGDGFAFVTYRRKAV